MKNIFLFILLVVVLIVGFGIFIFYLYQQDIERIENDRIGDLSVITDTIANDLGYIFTTTERDLKLLSSIYRDRKPPTVEELSNIYNTAFDINSFLINIFYMDSDGTMRAIGPGKYSKEIGNKYAFRSYFLNAKNSGGSFFSEVLSNYKAKSSEEEYDSVVVVLPVYNKMKQFKGLFGANLDLNKLQKRIQTGVMSKSTTKGGLYFIDYKNKQIVSGSNKIKNTPIFERFLLSVSAKEGNKSIDKNKFTFNGKKYFCSSKLIKNKKFTFQVLGIFPSTDSVFSLKGLYKQISGIAIIVGAVILIALFIIIYNEKIMKKLKKRIEVLEINIDSTKKEKDVGNIIDSDYYRELQNKINAIREKK